MESNNMLLEIAELKLGYYFIFNSFLVSAILIFLALSTKPAVAVSTPVFKKSKENTSKANTQKDFDEESNESDIKDQEILMSKSRTTASPRKAEEKSRSTSPTRTRRSAATKKMD